MNGPLDDVRLALELRESAYLMGYLEVRRAVEALERLEAALVAEGEEGLEYGE